ncbi:hypothetical protein CTI12_AA040990 [Artemisia annua]|uniref:Uncharacterized protein n=1 Tax=Artemisia annua TaxID=35608 RepID=A0A2U1QEF3_ARTAN|nr:hypothetical protein CTI12_AA040990 [Artemisia annua]
MDSYLRTPLRVHQNLSPSAVAHDSPPKPIQRRRRRERENEDTVADQDPPKPKLAYNNKSFIKPLNLGLVFDELANGDDSEFLTPQRKLLNSIDIVEKVFMQELDKFKATPSAKNAEREKKVRTLMSMRAVSEIGHNEIYGADLDSAMPSMKLDWIPSVNRLMASQDHTVVRLGFQGI